MNWQIGGLCVILIVVGLLPLSIVVMDKVERDATLLAPAPTTTTVVTPADLQPIRDDIASLRDRLIAQADLTQQLRAAESRAVAAELQLTVYEGAQVCGPATIVQTVGQNVFSVAELTLCGYNLRLGGGDGFEQ